MTRLAEPASCYQCYRIRLYYILRHITSKGTVHSLPCAHRRHGLSAGPDKLRHEPLCSTGKRPSGKKIDQVDNVLFLIGNPIWSKYCGVHELISNRSCRRKVIVHMFSGQTFVRRQPSLPKRRISTWGMNVRTSPQR